MFYLPPSIVSEKTTTRSLYDYQDHDKISERLRKTLYYGKLPTTDRPSLPVTELAVEFFQEAAPRELDKINTMAAAQSSRRACMSPCCVMLGMLYVKRLKERNPEYLQKVSSSDLFFISVMMASKFLYDEGVDEEVYNDEWAESGDMEIEDVNKLEREFLSAVDWQLFARQEDFIAVLNSIEKRIAWKKGRERGWFSYTDLMILTLDPQWSEICLNLTKDLTQVMVVSSVAYLAAVLTMVGSTALVVTLTPAIAFHCPVIPQASTLLPLPQPDDHTYTNTEDVETNPEVLTEMLVSGDVETRQLSKNYQMDRIISHLFAVVTLKNNFMQFLFAIQQSPSQPQTISSDHSGQFQVCTDRPCSDAGESRCHNVTSWKASEGSVCCGECKKQFASVSNDDSMNWYKRDGLSASGFGYNVMCCCDQDNSGYGLSQTGLIFHRFPDLIAGFRTGSHLLTAAA